MAAVQSARREHDLANETFWKLCLSVPNATPATGPAAIQTAAREQNVTRRALLESIRSLNRFLSGGDVAFKMADAGAAQSVPGF